MTNEIVHYILTFVAVLAAILVAPIARAFISKNADDYIAAAKQGVEAALRWRGWRTIWYTALFFLFIGMCVGGVILMHAARRNRDLEWVLPVSMTIFALGYWVWFAWGVKNRNLEGIGWGLFGGILFGLMALFSWQVFL